MAKKRKSTRNNLKNFTLWQWGLTLIFAGIVANVVTGMMATPGTSAAARGQAFGRLLVTVVAVVAGIVMIVLHVVRKRR
jgi:dipeptide/tripeptide permease